MIPQGMEQALEYAQKSQLSHALNMHELIIEIDEKDIALLLGGLAQAGIVYSHISIEKPTLEQYFMQIAKRR